jgi:hypothetical protein
MLDYTLENVIDFINDEINEAYESAYCGDIVEGVIDAYENGVITYEEADAYLELISEAKDDGYKETKKYIKDRYKSSKGAVDDTYKAELDKIRAAKKDARKDPYTVYDKDYYKALRDIARDKKKQGRDELRGARKNLKSSLRNNEKSDRFDDRVERKAGRYADRLEKYINKHGRTVDDYDI